MAEKIWHVEFAVNDKMEAAKWYNNVLGWKVEHFEAMDYIQVRSGDTEPTLAFQPGQPEQGMPVGAALVYLDTDDLEDLISRVKAAGGQILMETMDIPMVGKMSMFADPYGNRMAAMQQAEM